jgi:Bifunctional DNA primase/polymerase, N-terminal/Primase C terminal 1 (PriCT-1)
MADDARISTALPSQGVGRMTPASKADGLERVLSLAARGWRLLPCAERGKTPLLSDWTRRASCDIGTICMWAKKHVGCNWGVLCGADSGVWVLDVDGESGDASLRSLVEQHGDEWTRTLAVTTARGQHLYFSHPGSGNAIRTNAGKLGVGLDVRGDGGYALVPPSTHPSGTPYEWTSPLNELAPISAPAWLLESVRSAERPFVRAADVDVISEGRRNDTLTRVGGYLRRKGATAPEITSALLDQNLRRCRPPLSESEVRLIASSVSRYEPGGPDPLESAWQAIQAQTYPSRYERFLALARQLQLARPGQTIALPLKRIAELMGVHWTTVSVYRQKAVTDGLLEPAGEYIAHRRAGLYRISERAETLTKTLTTGLVRVCENSYSENPIVRVNSISRSESPVVRGENPHSESEDPEAELRFQKSLSRKAVTRIWHLYPGNERLEDQALSLPQALMIFEAARRDGLKVLNATRAFAAAVKEWPAEEQKRIPPWEQWYSASEYLKDPAEWTPAQDGDFRHSGLQFFEGRGERGENQPEGSIESGRSCPMK